MTGVILAGGESRRMGREKAFLDFRGRPLIEHLLELFGRQFERTIIVTRDPEKFRNCSALVVADAHSAPGPLTGIYTALLHAGTGLCFVAACDMPFLSLPLIAHLGRLAGGFDAVVPRPGGRPEPLHAVYCASALPVIRAALDAGERKVSAVLERLDVRYLDDGEIALVDPGTRSFRNINTPEEYKEAVCSDWECRN